MGRRLMGNGRSACACLSACYVIAPMLLRSTLLRWHVCTAVVTGGSLLFACTEAPGKNSVKKRTPADPGDEFFDEEVATDDALAPVTNPDSGGFGASERPAPKDAGANTGVDVDGGLPDAGAVAYCDGPLTAGDLQIAELAIASRTGSGDDAEWVEIRNTRSCTWKLKGLVITSPRGASTPDSATINEDFELGPQRSFLVAGSTDPRKNHGLPGKVFGWENTDVLKNDGDTITVTMGSIVVDTLTYPAFSNLTRGRSLSFPFDCPSNTRSDWQRWSLSFAEWNAGFLGTPNATNNDVACY